MSVSVGHRNRAFGSSRSASSAYQKWPTRHPDSNRTRPRGSGGPGFSPVESLRIGRGRFVPEASNHSLYRMKLRMYRAPAILRETSEGTSY